MIASSSVRMDSCCIDRQGSGGCQVPFDCLNRHKALSSWPARRGMLRWAAAPIQTRLAGVRAGMQYQCLTEGQMSGQLCRFRPPCAGTCSNWFSALYHKCWALLSQQTFSPGAVPRAEARVFDTAGLDVAGVRASSIQACLDCSCSSTDSQTSRQRCRAAGERSAEALQSLSCDAWVLYWQARLKRSGGCTLWQLRSGPGSAALGDKLPR